MSNPRITKKEMGLIKGALNRVFSRSELRKAALDAAEIKHSDLKRPRVTRWIACAICNKPYPRYLAEVDHILPRIPVDTSFEEMSKDLFLDRTWCPLTGLQVLDILCHKAKTALERKSRTNKKRKPKARRRRR